MTLTGEIETVPPTVAAAVYRLAQESITNARRHAKHATRVTVSVDVNAERVRLEVIDDGDTVGSPAAQAGPEGITFDPITEYAYVTLHGTNQVVAIDLRTRKTMGFGSVGAGPDGIGYSPLVRR